MNPFERRSPITTMIFLFLRSAQHGTDKSLAIRASRAACSCLSVLSGCEKLKPCAYAGTTHTKEAASNSRAGSDGISLMDRIAVGRVRNGQDYRNVRI